MNPDAASRTAIATALMRSLHTRSDPLRILDDPWGERLAPPVVRQRVYQMARGRDPALPDAPDAATQQRAVDAYLHSNAAYANVILRSRYAEDMLRQALARGVRQYVLIGAGFDSYALRRPPEAVNLVVTEIDHPASQALKRQCIEAAGAPWPADARFLAADLSTEDLPSVLRRSGLRLGEPVFFSWLGVTMYLTREANLATLRAIATTVAAGSELVFSYLDQVRLDTPLADMSPELRALHQDVAAVGEPFVSGFVPAALGNELKALGYTVLEDCTDVELLRRYDPQRRNGLVARETSRIAHARVG